MGGPTDSIERFLDELAAERFGDTVPLYAAAPRLAGEADAAGEIRLANLRSYLAARETPCAVAVGEAPSYRGMRWTGIAFTSERQLRQWGAPYRTTSSEPNGWAEPSATIVHGALDELDAERKVVLWNAVPAHPCKPGQPLTNRPPTVPERELGRVWTERLIAILNPTKVIAIGRTAQAILDDSVPCVRHPAQGGATKFREAMRELLRDC
jgi:hypothetical protein